jgi:hypothetical protein
MVKCQLVTFADKANIVTLEKENEGEIQTQLIRSIDQTGKQ